MSTVNEVVSQWLSGGQQSSAGSVKDGTVVDANDSISADSSGGEHEVRSENSVVDDLLPGDSEDTPTDQPEAAEPKADGKQVASDKEITTVTDESGRKRKIEIDYSNREATKKAHLEAAGFRKMQAERDQEKTSRKGLEAKLQEREKDWSALENAFQQGPEKLFDLLTGRQGAFDEAVAKRQQKAEFLKNASPEEIRVMEANERAEAQSKELDRIRKENEKFKKEVTQERETAELKSLESKVNPVFSKYSFTDKLGNEDREQMFNEMLWNTALKRLEPYEEKGIDITNELVDSKFREVATALRTQITKQADKRVGKVVDQKKQEATENVQSKVMSGYKTGGGRAQEARNLIQKNDLTGLLKGWGTYGSLFGKK